MLLGPTIGGLVVGSVARAGMWLLWAAVALILVVWAERLGRIEVKTNRPDFDRLVNVWLPYQLYTSRLFGRVGPNQRGGAIGHGHCGGDLRRGFGIV